MRLFLSGSGMVIMALCTHGSLPAQETASNSQEMMVSVPFTGCASGGQVGPIEAPKGAGRSVPIRRDAAQKLAYYESAQGIGVLAPRGWYCFGTIGSGGETLVVSPKPIDTEDLFSSRRGSFVGPAISVSHSFGDTSGRFNVAEVIARVFPAYRAFAVGFMKDFDQPASALLFGPYPSDTLTYKSETVVEYTTPAHTDGLGTHSWLKKNASPIEGVAILIGRTPDLLLLAVRLPADVNGLMSAIICQAERDAARLPHD